MMVSMFCPECTEQREFLHVEGRVCVCRICGAEAKTTAEIAFLAEYTALRADRRTGTAISKLRTRYGLTKRKAAAYIKESI